MSVIHLCGGSVVRRLSLEWHKKLALWGAFVVLAWGISGISHPLMARFGPQVAQFYPPKLALTAEQMQAVPNVLAQQTVTQPLVVKVVPSEWGAVLQITEAENTARRYFGLATGQEIPDADQQQARWLASHYSGRSQADIQHVDFINTFSDAYPWVNRLLPVYRVQFKGDDHLQVYVHTETSAMGSISDVTRDRLRQVFMALHTWSWLDVAGSGRVILLAALMLTLLAMSVTGLNLVLLIKHRSIKQAGRRWHRLLGYALWLPLLGWSASGFYHLLQAEYAPTVAGMRLGPALDTKQLNQGESIDWNPLVQQQSLNAVSLVEGDGQQLFYRLSLAPQPKGEAISKNQHFDGLAKERGALYVNALNGSATELTDREQAMLLAERLTGLPASQVAGVELITHFGPGYDFRNKRLPVWQIDYQTAEGLRVFVDPATGLLVDQNHRLHRLEGLSFSLLHKWNHLRPLIGREIRDVLIVITLLVAIVSAVLGVRMRLKQKR